MHRSNPDVEVFKILARKYNLNVTDIRSIVNSFFDIVQIDASKLPLDNMSRIYSRGKFKEFETAYMIPFIGRIGPVYSRYLIWRRNVSLSSSQLRRDKFKSKCHVDKADMLAQSILNGVPYTPQESVKDCKRVWMVGTDGKKLARQVLVEDEKV